MCCLVEAIALDQAATARFRAVVLTVGVVFLVLAGERSGAVSSGLSADNAAASAIRRASS